MLVKYYVLKHDRNLSLRLISPFCISSRKNIVLALRSYRLRFLLEYSFPISFCCYSLQTKKSD